MAMQRHLPLALVLACLVFVFFAYYPGTSGYFIFDDTLNIVDNPSLRIHTLDFAALKQAAPSGDAGISGRPLSMLSFALNYYFTGLAPYYFKLTNIAIHLLNGLCVYVLTLQILAACCQRGLSTISQAYTRWVSLAVTAAWLLHPLNLTAVLYIVQRMTSLAALFSLLGLISYVYGRRQLAAGKRGWTWILAAFVLFTPLAFFSKENGALLPAFMLLVEIVFFRFQAPSSGARSTLIVLFGVTVILPGIAALTYLIVHPGWLTAGYSVRDFTLGERLMTEARILWFYIQTIFVPNLSQLGMYHDDIPVSKGLFNPESTFFACLGILLLPVVAGLIWKRQPIAAFGILFFLVGHSMESSVLALELVHEHRNYLPDYGLLLPLFYYLLYPLRHAQSLKARQGLAVVFIFMLAGLTYMRATQWGDPFLMKQMAAENHPDSIRANIDIASVYAATPALSQAQADALYRSASEHYEKASTLSPSETMGLFGLIAMNSRYNLPIETAWVSSLADRLEHYPFSANTSNAVASLEKCIVAGNCKNIDQVMEGLFKAALKNPTLGGRSKIQVLFAWSDFLFRIKHDRIAAKQAAYEAAMTNPQNLESKLTLATMLINMGEITEAETQIEQVQAGDRMQLHTATLDSLQKSITQLKTDSRHDQGQ
jgi:hypothetical protein